MGGPARPIAAGEGRHLVAAPVELLDELVDDALGPAVRARRDASIGGATWAMRSGRVMVLPGRRDRGPQSGPTVSRVPMADRFGAESQRGLWSGCSTLRPLPRSGHRHRLRRRPDRGADDGTRRSGHRAADDRAGGAATKRAGPGSGLVVTFCRLAGDRAGNATDAATDDGPEVHRRPSRRPPAETPRRRRRGLVTRSSFSGAVPSRV